MPAHYAASLKTFVRADRDCIVGRLTAQGAAAGFYQQWNCRSFRGTRRTKVRNDTMRRYINNKSRVLWTRAREGAVVWVPEGSVQDGTRPPEVYDAVADYLAECGVIRL